MPVNCMTMEQPPLSQGFRPCTVDREGVHLKHGGYTRAIAPGIREESSRRNEKDPMDRSRLSRFVNQRLSELSLQEPAVVSPFTSVRSAVGVMQERAHSCVLAMEGGHLQGIFTERDVLTKCMDDGFDWDQPINASVLTKQPTTIASTRTVAEAIATMQKHHYRTLPVVEGETVVGLVRLGDLLKDLAEAYPEDVLNLPPRPHQVMERPEGG